MLAADQRVRGEGLRAGPLTPVIGTAPFYYITYQ